MKLELSYILSFIWLMTVRRKPRASENFIKFLVNALTNKTFSLNYVTIIETFSLTFD